MNTSNFDLKGHGGMILLVIVLASLVGTLVFFHLLVLLGVGLVGTVAYGLDRTAGVSINNKRFPATIEGQDPRKERGLFIYEQDMWTRLKFLFWVFLIWFVGGFFLGKFGLSNAMEIPAQAAAFFVGMLFGPIGFRVWQNRREFAAKADAFEKGLKEGTIDPVAAARSAATSVGAGFASVVGEMTKATEPEKQAEPPRVVRESEIPVAPTPVVPPEPAPDDVISRFLGKGN